MGKEGTQTPVATTKPGNLHSSEFETLPAMANFFFELTHTSQIYVGWNETGLFAVKMLVDTQEL